MNAVTRTCATVRCYNFISVIIILLFSGSVYGQQLTGIKTIPGNYLTIKDAVADLDLNGAGTGGVTFNIAAGYTETISSTISLTSTGTSANPVVFQKDPSTTGANPLVTAYTGVNTPASATQDGIWRLVGSDYVTIDGIDVKDNPANTTNPATMEYGYALYKAGPSNGCQFVTIKNCVITLSNINDAAGAAPMSDGSSGIVVMNASYSAATTSITPVAGGTNSNNKFYGNTIQNCNTGIALSGYTGASSPFTLADNFNDVGGIASTTGNTIVNYGGAVTAATAAVAISTLAQYNLTISYNTINNNNGSGTNHANTLRGILIGAATSAGVTVTYNTITLNGGGTIQTLTGIENAAGSTAAGNTINLSNNSIINCTYTTATTGVIIGIYNNNTTPAILNINNNTLAGNATSASSGNYTPIYNTGTVTGAININANNIGTSISPAITFTAVNSGTQTFINNAKGGGAATLSISNNNFYNVLYAQPGTGSNTYIFNGAATLTQAINYNTFSNLNVNTNNAVTFISNSVALPATGTQNVNYNSISGTFAKAAGSSVTLFTSSATSTAGSITNNNNNNFSNITVTGTTVLNGWFYLDGGTSNKTIKNNIFSNWSAGTGLANGMNINLNGANCAITGNAINNIFGGGIVTGITTAAGNDNIYGNTINTLSSSGAVAVNGISVTSGTSKNIYGNKIYDLQASIAGGTTNGIIVSGSSVVNANIYNNLIGDLRTPAASATDPIRGISIISFTSNSTVNVYNNTIYLNASSTGATFGTTGIYHVANATATICALTLKNNIIVNTSTPNGTGLTVAYRRSLNTVANYAAASNNNLFYAGPAAANRLIFYDNTSADQTLSTYKARVSTRDAQSVSEDLIGTSKFLSTTGSSANYLHMDPAKASQVESGGININNLVTDYDGQTRQGNPGYSGTGTAPDIGADEYEGSTLPVISGTYNVGAGQTYTSLTNAGGLFAAINTLGLTGSIIVNVTSDLTEDGTNSLYKWAEQGSGNYTLTIQPDGPTQRIISGNVLTGLIHLNGVSRVIIDGRYGGSGTYLTFRNANTAGTTGNAFTFINGANSNILRYSNIEAFANATNGVILFSTSTIAGGNSNNVINNCNINATVGGNTGSVCIYAAGTTGNENATNTITANNILNYRDRGLDITSSGSKSWTISGNSFYNGDVTGAINYALGSTLHGIRILGGTGYAILNNYIGGNAPLAAGTNAVYSSTLGIVSYQGVLLTSSAATPVSSIKGNTIGRISVSAVPTVSTTATVFIGIETNGAGINIGGSLAGDGNMIGSNTTNGSVVVTTTTTSTLYKSTIKGINCLSTGGLVTGNHVSGIDIKNIGTTPAASAFTGIYVNAATAPPVNNNVVGSTGTGAVLNSIRVLSTSTSASTGLTGILVGAAVTSSMQVDGNIIQNMSHQSTTASGTIAGIANSAPAPAAITINNNLISSNTINATSGSFNGIYNYNISPASLTITNNTFSSNVSTSTGTGSMTGVYLLGAPPTTIVNNNTVSGNSTAALTTGLFCGIYNSSAGATLNITGNTISGNTTTSTSGAFYSIYNTGAVTGAININANNLGTGVSPAITFSAANSGTQIYINNTGGTAAAALSISNNNFYNLLYATTGTGANTYISNSAATLSQAINSNNFNNITTKTAGSVTFISNSVVLSATGTQNINNNIISGTFTKSVQGGTVTLFTSAASSVAGSVINHSNNNFSNITIAGTTAMAGWAITDAGSGSRTMQNNVFSNWTGNTGAITAISANVTAAGNATTRNTVDSIYGAGPITGIITGTGNDNIFLNTINTLSTTGAATVTGISITGGTTKNIYKNKIYDLQANNATGAVNGILMSGTTVTGNIYNNLIGDLRTPVENNATDGIRGISVTSTTASTTTNVYYNTIYINATSTGAAFGSSGVYHVTSATATTATLNLRNNSITNISTPKGTGVTAAYKRSTPALTNYATTSNNNLFYAGTPGQYTVIYSDGTNSDLTIAAYKSRVAPADAASLSDSLRAKFLSTSGSSPLYLHMDATKSSSVESGAVNIAGFTDDYDGQVRAGNAGYSGTGTLPDIGADEVFGIENVPPVISYTPLTNATSTANRDVTAVTITDVSGVNNTPGLAPRIYYKRSGDANAWLDNTSNTNGWKYTEATNSASPFTFTINYALLYGGSAAAGVIQYFIVAQDLSTIANVGINAATFAATPVNVALTSAAFPIGGAINSYIIPFSGTYNVGATEAFSSLTKAGGLFAAVNAAGLMGNTTINITSDLSEDGTNALNQWTESGSGNYTIIIQPDAPNQRNITGNAAGGLIRFNGADRVTVDGSSGGSGSYLSFKNTSNAGTTGTAFTFINGATNNTIRYCDAEAFANAANGVIFFSTSSVAGGNSNNTVDNCTVNATVASNTGNVAIYSSGTVGNENAANTISNNSIFNYRDRGLDVSATGSTGWMITGNSFYNGQVTGTINYASSSALHGIRVLGGSGYSILNNFIGSDDVLASGANAVYSSTFGDLLFQGILLTTGNALPASSIKGNTISSISISSVPTAPNSRVFTGIATNGSGINIGGSTAADGNIIGSAVNSGSIIITTSTTSAGNTSIVTGISCASSGGVVNNNQVSGLDVSNVGATPAPSVVQGIYVNNAAAPAQVNNNLIGSRSASNSIRIMPGSVASSSVTGIEIGTAVNASLQVSGNRIENIANLSTTSSGSFTGINNTTVLSSAMITIGSDTIQQINTTANASTGSAVYSGIISGSASVISNNLINNIILSSTGVNAQVAGINVSGAYANTIAGNTISNISTASRKATAVAETGNPAGSTVIGILNSATAAGQVINNNTLAALTATSTAAVNVVVTGIGINATGSGSIYNNRMGTSTNTATGAGPALCAIMAANGSFVVYNNSIRVSNLTYTTGLKIYGINHAAATNWYYYHNSVRVGGNSVGTALRTAAFIVSLNGPFVLKDNVLVNYRTGTGANYGVSNLGSPPGNWPSTACDYNDIYSSNTNTVGEWGAGTGETFAQWKNVSGGDAHSVSNAVSFLTSVNDLQPDSISNCTLNGTGTPVTTPVVINTDIFNATRSAVNPDIGAYEFNYNTFSIIAGSNSPVCSGDSVMLSVNPGGALNPTFSWKNPANVIVATTQNPTVAASPGQYKVSVTDVNGCYVTDSTLVSINQQLTATITSVTSLCDSGFVSLNIHVTGTGLISVRVNNGDSITGYAPLIIDTVFVTATTSYHITNLSAGNCTAALADISDIVTVTVTHKGSWLGINTNWNDPVNWCAGILPTSTTDVNIPAGTSRMPVVSTAANCRNLFISAGDTLTVTSAGTLNIAGTLTSNGAYTDNGTTVFNSTSGQQTFSGVTTFNNLTLNNTGGLLLSASVAIKSNLTLTAGTFNTNDLAVSVAGNWINNASATAFSAGIGTVTFNGTAAQVVAGAFATTFNHLTVSNTASTVSLNVNANIAGNLLVTTGTFDLGAYSTNRTTAGGTLTVANNATLKIGGTGTFPINYTINNLVVASTVEYSGANQNVADKPYGNLTLSSASGTVIKTLPASALTVIGNLTSMAGAGTAVSFNAASAITVGGNVSIGASTIFNGGSYVHTIGGNWTNGGTFNGNTGTVIFNRSGAVVAGTGAQNFNNLTVAASGVTFSSGSITLSGNLATTGSGTFTQGPGGTILMTGSAASISGLGISLNNLTVSGSVTTSASLTFTGNLAVSGSFAAGSNTITFTGASKTISGAGTIAFYSVSFVGSTTATTGFSIASALFVYGTFSASAGTATFTGTSSLSGTANLNNVTVNGTLLQLSTGSVLGIAGALTITSGLLDAATNGPNTVNFNGTGAQNVNGITYSNLIMSNGSIKTATGNFTTAFDITIASGTTFVPSSYTHTTYGNWINNGIFNAGTSTILFLGPANGFISGVTTFNILTINTTNATTEILLQDNISAATVNMTNGIIVTGADTITITNTRTGAGFIYGNICRTHTFTTGIAYAFEGPDNSITFTSVTGVGSVIVSVTKGQVIDFPFGGSISRVYDIHVPAGSYTATLRLHYEDNELNGNSEASMALWHYNGSMWGSIGKTANSATANYVEQSSLTDITNRWTCSDNANLVQWNGSVSTDWNTAANWTVLQGAGSRPPSAADIVQLGTTTFTNQPTITTAVTVKNIVFGSNQAVALTLGSGGSLTTSGDINGNWSANATHSINVNNQALTVNGNITLSDSTSGHAINLNIGTGSVTTLGSLFESGGAKVTFSGTGTLNVYKNFTFSSGTFTPGGGTVIYNGTENQNVANVGYNNLAISKSAGLATINDSVNIAGNLLVSSGELDNFSTIRVAGDVTINTGGTFNNNSFLHINGNWSNSGSYVPNSSSIYFEGTGTQAISGSTFNNLEINKPATSVAVLTGDVILNGNLVGRSGTLDIKSFFFNRQVTGGTATILDSATLIIAADNAPNKFASYLLAPNSTVIFNGTGLQHLLLPGVVYGNITFRNSGLKTLYTPITVNNKFLIESTASFNAGASTITLNGNWENNGTFVPATSTVLLNGTTKTVTGNTTFNQATVTGSYTFLSDITFNGLLNITSTGALRAGPSILVTMNADLINSGILYTLGTTTFTGNVQQTLSLINAVQTVAITVNFNGTVSPVLNSTSVPQYGFLNINNTGGVNPSVGWMIQYALNVGSGASFNGGASSHIVYGSVTNNGAITSSGTLSFLPSAAATINLGINFSSTGRVYFGGAGAMTLTGTPGSFNNVNINSTNPAGITPSSAWNIAKDLRVVGGSVLNAGSYVHSVGGNISNSGTINAGSGTFTLNGTATQDINSASAFNNLTLNKAAGVVTLSSNATVGGALSFVKGNIQTGIYSLIQPSSGTVSGAAQSTGWVNGKLQKYIATGAPTKSFEIGDTVNYIPVSLAFSSVSTAGGLTVFTINGDHPNIGRSVINAFKSVNRFWNLTNSGIIFTNYSTTLSFVPTDIDAGASTSSFKTGLYNGSSWTVPVTASPNATNITATGVTAFGDFAAGEACNAGTTILYAASPYCSSAGTASVTRTGMAGGSYTSTTGLTINSGTGDITLNSSAAGTYTVTYTVAAAGGCAAYSTTAVITITTQPFANGYYPGSPYCANEGSAYPIGSTAGAYGTLSSAAGLSLDQYNGVVNLAASTPGTYTVTYTVPASGGCAVYTSASTIAITAVPSATITYPGSPYCSNAGTASVIRTGTAGGTFSSTAGLSINATTGDVNLASSIPDTYTITYTINATGGCQTYTTTASISISPAAAAAIAYTASPYCKNAGTAFVTRTGTAGGTYTSSAGLSIDAATGDITLAESTIGTYTVTYRVAATITCGEFITTASITIKSVGIWTGAVSTDFNDAANWVCGGVPTIISSIVIPTGLSQYPVITGQNAINDLTIEAGASLILNGALQVAGTITSSGTFTASAGTLNMNGITAQQLPAGLFSGDLVSNLIISNSAGVTLASTLNLTGVLTISAGQLNTNGHLILKSSAAATASLAQITSPASTPVNGDVTVERYIPGRRKYRLITSSVTTSAAAALSPGQESRSMWANWQNSGINAAAKGTSITGGTAADGFDQQTSAASLYTYDQINRNYLPYTSAAGKNTKLTPLKAGQAYYMFVYGDRTDPLYTPTPHATVLSATGALTTGDQTYTTTSAIPLNPTTGLFTLLGNPFASPIDWSLISGTNIDNSYWGWDPNLNSTGGYVTVSTIGAVTLISPFSGSTGLNQYIQSGQGFFVKTTGPSPTLTIREQDKAGTNNVNAFRVSGPGSTPALIAVNLLYGSGGTEVLADGALAAFDESFVNTVSAQDASKMSGTAESVALLEAGQLLSIDARRLPVSTDTLQLSMARLSRPRYTLQIFTKDLEAAVQPYLTDRFLATLTPLSVTDTTRIVFDVTAEAGSYSSSRFSIVFRSTATVLPLTFLGLTAEKTNGQVQLRWTVAMEEAVSYYQVERSGDGQAFVQTAQVKAKAAGAAITAYSWLDVNPVAGSSFYRITSVLRDGQKVLSPVVQVRFEDAAGSVSFYPNPLTSQEVNVQFSHMAQGWYELSLYDRFGKKVTAMRVHHGPADESPKVHISTFLAEGMYYLRIDGDHFSASKKIFVE